MKKLLYIFCLTVALFSCKRTDPNGNLGNHPIIGKWVDVKLSSSDGDTKSDIYSLAFTDKGTGVINQQSLVGSEALFENVVDFNFIIRDDLLTVIATVDGYSLTAKYRVIDNTLTLIDLTNGETLILTRY